MANSRTRPAELEHTRENCHAHEMLTRIGDKWSVYVIHVLGDAGTLRFTELRARVDGIRQRMLTVTLRGLVRGLVKWSGAHLPEVDAARTKYDAKQTKRTKSA